VAELKRIQVVDSHTGGEPTRVVIEGGPDLGSGSMAERLAALRRQDGFRSAVVNEPRGSDVVVGALLVPPVDPACATGVIFFNNVGYLGMCGHGLIGVVETLAHLERLKSGTIRIETPVGEVWAKRNADGSVSMGNVTSYRLTKSVGIAVPGLGRVMGDVAWGGNWFFLIEQHGQRLELDNVEALIEYTWRVRQTLKEKGITGKNGAEIDHIELFGPSAKPGVNSRNFVLCPGKAYDRSPCGTGTSAKLACLFADGKLKPGEIWRQESIVGSVFEGSVEPAGVAVVPTIAGRAFVTAEATLILNPDDPFVEGIRS
jgi:4-hydroxyproline epimerase